ncbi:MAG TPA: hypothetical protein DC038_08135 [Clostridiales bacterium]|nr:hypothetical protein [Clostridiales bacterium]
MVFCVHCGCIFRRIKWNNRGCKSTVWRCTSRVDKDGPDCIMAALDEQIKTLQHELLAKADLKNPGDDLGMEVRRLRNEKQALQVEEASHQDLKLRIDDMMTFLDGQSCELTEYDEQYVRTLIEKITVYDDYFVVEFKSGIEIQIVE